MTRVVELFKKLEHANRATYCGHAWTNHSMGRLHQAACEEVWRKYGEVTLLYKVNKKISGTASPYRQRADHSQPLGLRLDFKC
uniref:60S ribosomal protein L35a n=1 Tax=Steinernema glaseri TaxID=37863 RepID=A0A1I7Y6K4_9BILA